MIRLRRFDVRFVRVRRLVLPVLRSGCFGLRRRVALTDPDLGLVEGRLVTRPSSQSDPNALQIHGAAGSCNLRSSEMHDGDRHSECKCAHGHREVPQEPEAQQPNQEKSAKETQQTPGAQQGGQRAASLRGPTSPDTNGQHSKAGQQSDEVHEVTFAGNSKLEHRGEPLDLPG
jgi:hypothetical protein